MFLVAARRVLGWRPTGSRGDAEGETRFLAETPARKSPSNVQGAERANKEPELAVPKDGDPDAMPRRARANADELPQAQCRTQHGERGKREPIGAADPTVEIGMEYVGDVGRRRAREFELAC